MSFHFDFEEDEHQAHLSLRWETRKFWSSLTDAIKPARPSETFAAIVLALLTEADAQGRRTSYSRAKEHYTRPRRYAHTLYTYRHVVSAVDELERLNLIHHDRRLPGQRGWQSSMCATPEMLDIVRIAMSGEQPQLQSLREPLLLRGADKELIDYRDNRLTDRMRRELQEQNEALASADFGTVLPFPSRLRRIFNADFDHGGRCYAEGGGWQTLSKADRLRINLDGEPVVEIDYAMLHPVLAYAKLGLPAPDAPYEIPGFPRDLVKIAFNVLLNGSSPSGARHTIAHKPGMVRLLLGLEVAENELSASYWRRVHQRDASYSQRASTRAEQLIKALLAKHERIRDLFFTGVGLRLQRLDSDIAEGVMKSMRRRGTLVLPVHDSFLAPASKADLLEEIMRDEAAKRGAKVSCKCSP